MNPGRLTTPREEVRQLQEKLGHAAKASQKRRFHALYDKVYRMDVLQEAWVRVRANQGAAGIDRQTLADIETMGVQQFLMECQQSLKEGMLISDRRVLKLIRKWLQAGVMEEGELRHAALGTPQGGVISPLLANIYLNYFGKNAWRKKLLNGEASIRGWTWMIYHYSIHLDRFFPMRPDNQ